MPDCKNKVSYLPILSVKQYFSCQFYRQKNKNCLKLQNYFEVLFLQITLGYSVEGINTAVAQEGPPAAYLFAACRIYLDH